MEDVCVCKFWLVELQETISQFLLRYRCAIKTGNYIFLVNLEVLKDHHKKAEYNKVIPLKSFCNARLHRLSILDVGILKRNFVKGKVTCSRLVALPSLHVQSRLRCIRKIMTICQNHQWH